MARKRIEISEIGLKRQRETVEEYCAMKKVKQKDFAKDVAQISPEQLSKILHGKVGMSLGTAKEIEKNIGVRDNFLLGYDDYKTEMDLQNHLEEEGKKALIGAAANYRDFIEWANCWGYNIKAYYVGERTTKYVISKEIFSKTEQYECSVEDFLWLYKDALRYIEFRLDRFMDDCRRKERRKSISFGDRESGNE